MKKIAALVLSSVFMALPINTSMAQADATATTMPEDQKQGYSLGIFMGSQIRASLEAQGLEVNQEAFAKGLKEGISNTTPSLSTEEIQKSLNTLQQDAQTKLDGKVRTLAAARANDLFGQQQIIVAGNPKGTVTLVEFYDYECPHCKAMNPLIEQLIKSNKDLRVVYRPFPIINANSTNAAGAALVAQSQDKFSALHNAMMEATAPLNEDQIRLLVRKVKMDPKKYEIAIKGNHIKEELQNNRDLAVAAGLRGTPSFLVAKTVTNPDDKATWPDENHIYFAAGEVPETTLKDYIDKAAK